MVSMSDSELTNASLNLYTLLNRNFTGLNVSVNEDPEVSPSYVLLRRMQTVLIPIICSLGILGNVLAAGTFLSPSLRGISCCLYLTAKTVSDIGFLLSLFIVWLYRVHVPLLNTQGVCQITIFFSYVCGFLSVWFVVIITFENFIRISQPWRIAMLCSQRHAVIVISTILFFTSVLYSFPLWTTGIVPNLNPKCQSLLRFQHIVLAMTYVDTGLTLILPLIVMIFLVLAIMFSAFKAYKRKLRLRAQNHEANGKIHTPEGTVSRFLFAVSVIFLVLHTPSHAIRIKLVILRNFYQEMPSVLDLMLQRIFETFFYLNFSLNCVIYLIFGENFRKVFRKLYFMRCQRKNMSDVTEINNLAPLMHTGWSMSDASVLETSK